ncbi:hypothetical protein [Kurthia sibirica]|uniref:Uncharacterized protein n=1 Tax=Kurthia sibirica TaxID=202750 RepID=A0A2U3ALJ2_9BACL|nr:hypothetical protein [Kurthia sibirica]PWI25380.1 hypothetical protein DEX24_08560 [Kurthia sibirica]GEK34603.1 hypothetical protein KSI01_21360 [Kurthia sibirica]
MMNRLISRQQRQEVAARINDFYILCIYSNAKMTNKYDFLTHKFDNSAVIELSETTFNLTSKSFIVWDKSYAENEGIFFSIRMQARQETIIGLSKALVSYYLKKNDTSIGKFKDTYVIDDVLLAIQKLIYASNCLNEEEWRHFYQDFRDEVKLWVIEGMLKTRSIEELTALSDEDMNDEFFICMTEQLEKHQPFKDFMVQSTTVYLQKWIDELILEFTEKEQFQRVLDELQVKRTRNESILLSFTTDQHLFVMNNMPYQIVREAIYKNNFTNNPFSSFPVTTIYKGNTEGQIELRPLVKKNPIEFAWHQSSTISDIDVDVFDALCNIYLSKKRVTKEVIRTELVDLLKFRGLKPKRSGDGRRGGFDVKQKQQIMQSLCNIQSIYMNLSKVLSYENGKPQITNLQGRTFLFKDEQFNDHQVDAEKPTKYIYFAIDDVFEAYLAGSGRQIALQHMKALHYHPVQQLYEKRLCRYLSWRWRTVARKGGFQTPNTISTMFESIGMKLNERTPSRTRERFERALDQLQLDGVIDSWQYDKWDEIIADMKGWSRVWFETGVVIKPPKAITEQYKKIEQKKK